MGNLGVPELLILVVVIGIAVGVTLAVRASKKRGAAVPAALRTAVPAAGATAPGAPLAPAGPLAAVSRVS
jgi:hypothetical protein